MLHLCGILFTGLVGGPVPVSTSDAMTLDLQSCSRTKVNITKMIMGSLPVPVLTPNIPEDFPEIPVGALNLKFALGNLTPNLARAALIYSADGEQKIMSLQVLKEFALTPGSLFQSVAVAIPRIKCTNDCGVVLNMEQDGKVLAAFCGAGISTQLTTAIASEATETPHSKSGPTLGETPRIISTADNTASSEPASGACELQMNKSVSWNLILCLLTALSICAFSLVRLRKYYRT